MPVFLTRQELEARYPLSARVRSPKELKELSQEELAQLAEEYRDYLIEVCSRNGGHLGPSLGVIELSFALHRVFDSPQDKIVWDIGHQAYPHKMITGRFEQLQTIREEGGISGFCRRTESEHDIMGAGHAGTSISTAVGIAEAYRLKKDPHKVIAIIGDASLTAGMAYEGLHQAEEYKKNLIVILNDNEMSISPNVGAVSKFLSRKMATPFIHKIQDDIKAVISKIPLVGNDVVEVLSDIKQTVKHMIIPTVIFEAFGFKYVGPIDGHDVPLLEKTLREAKAGNEPVFIHIITEKGRGYQPALADKVTFHGCGPYDRETGKLHKGKATAPTYSKVFGDTLTMIGKSDRRALAITGAMTTGTGLTGFAKDLPEQFYDVGIAEQHAVTFAAGLAIEGMVPYVAIYSTFMQRAYDQIIHDVCIQNLNVKFCMDRAGLVGADGATHHGIFDVGYLRMVPNMDVCAPRDEREFQELLAAMHKHIGPCAIRYPRGNGMGVPLYETMEEIPEIRWGSSEVVYFSGLANESGTASARSYSLETIEKAVKKTPAEVVLVGFGTTVNWCVTAAEELRAKGISAIVLNGRFAKPIDGETFNRLAALCPRFVTVEESARAAGFGSAVTEYFEATQQLHHLRVRSLGIPDRFFHHGNMDTLWSGAGIDIANIVREAEAITKEALEDQARVVGKLA